MRVANVRVYVRMYVMRAAGRNFRPILKRKPPFFIIFKYLEVLFLFFQFSKKSVTPLSPRGSLVLGSNQALGENRATLMFEFQEM